MRLYLGLLLMVAAPLAAQTSTHNIVFKIVLTTVTSSLLQPPIDNPGQPPVVVPDPPADPPTGSSGNPDPGSTSNAPVGCGGYSDAVIAMTHVYANLIYTQNLYAADQAAHPLSIAYAVNDQKLAQMQLAAQDIRDIIRVGGPQDIISQEVSGILRDVTSLPSLLADSPQLPLAPLIVDMQTGLVNAGKLVAASSCAESLP
jgi:hypothetical protein